MIYDPNESLIFRVPVPLAQLEFSGERFTTAVQGETRHEHLHRYLFALQFCRRKEVLDIASGEGYGAALIATIARTVTGVDISWEAIKHATKNYAGAHFLMGRAESLPLHDQSVDVVVSFETLEHLVDHDRFFQEIKRVLKADGILVMSSPDRDVYSIERGIENKHHLKELSSEEFQALVRGNFRHSSFMGQISMAGSIVVPQSGDLSGMRVQGFRHLSDNFVEAAPSVPSPTYVISVASDQPIPDICTGSFDDRPFQMGLYAELQQRQIRILQGEAEIANLRTEIAARESFLLESRSDRAKALKNVVQLEAELIKRNEQVESLRCKLTDSNHRQQEMAALICGQTTVSESLRAELARTQRETERRDLLSAQQFGVSESLRAELGLRQKEIERLGVMVAREVSTSNSLRAELARKQQELDSLSSRIELEVASTTSLRAELTEKRQQMDSLFSEINKETGSVVSLQAELAHKDLAAEAQHITMNKLSEKCASMQAQLDAIYASKSWLLSRPLRTIAGALRDQKLLVTAPLRLFAAFCSLRKIKAIRSLRLIFDRAFYLEHNPDVATARINPLLHYIIFGAGEGHDPCPLFDTSFYLARNPDVAAAKVNPLMHYLTHGAAEGRDPSALFDTSFYVERNPDVPAARVNPLLHFIKHGADEGRDPSPLFDTSFYMERNPDVVAARVNPLAHYLQHAGMENRDPHPLFHNLYYLQQNQDVAAARANPLVDYCERGFLQGRNPNPLFDSRYYLETNPDVALVGANPLSHFAASGFLQGRATHPLFDTAFYCERNPDILLANANPLEHFLSIGFTEDRDPHPWFDVSFYLQQSPWISQTGHNPLLHYLSWGAWEGKDPHPHFDSSYYLGTHPAVRSSGLNPLVHYILHGKKLGFDPNPYCKTILTPPPDLGCTTLPASRSRRQSIQPLDYQPLITVVLPTYNSEPLYLGLAIRSILQQSYTNWELCICDDGSSSRETLALLNKEAHRDKRINLRTLASNRGISEATNEALSMAQGEFVAFIDHDDEITRDALEEMVRAVNMHPAADVLYSDQDYVNKDGSIYSKFYKPDWSPELFCGVMYVGHLLVVRRTLALEVGGCDSRFDFVQDFEFMLRLSEKTPNIVHVAKILYHWRRLQGSVALHGDAKPNIENLQAAAVNAHFRRRGFPAVATSNPSHAHRLLIHPGPRKAFPTVTVLVDATDTSSDLSRSIASILDRTVYSGFEIGLLNSPTAGGNRSFGPYRVVGETLSSALAQIDSEFIALVGSDIEILTPDWLSHLLLYAEHPEIACVGPLILQPDGNVFSAGLVVTGASEIRMAMRGFKPESDGYAGSLSCAREVTALSPACIVVEAQKVRELKILEQFGLGPFQVIDLCMRAGQTGRRNICNPRAWVKLMREPVRQQEPRFDASLFQNLWQKEVEGHDRYHNPNFGNTDFAAKETNRVPMAST